VADIRPTGVGQGPHGPAPLQRADKLPAEFWGPEVTAARGVA
jgi:hypothetical protein